MPFEQTDSHVPKEPRISGDSLHMGDHISRIIFNTQNGRDADCRYHYCSKSLLVRPRIRGVATGWTGWTCPPHFCQWSLLRLMQIRWVFTREEGVGRLVMVWSLTHPSLPYVKFKMTIWEFAYKSGRQFEENIRHSTVIASDTPNSPQKNCPCPFDDNHLHLIHLYLNFDSLTSLLCLLLTVMTETFVTRMMLSRPIIWQR